jgi:L-threonylcarbamoyladenylate synthase
MLKNGRDPHVINEAAQALAAGALVAMPTETVYGLGARADDDAAVARIFAAKGRPSDHPLIVHVCDAEQAARFAAELPPLARKLMDAFWPGPLTVIVPRAPAMAAAAAGGQHSVGLRCPAHPVARALLAAARAEGVAGIAAPSANRFGRVSPTRAAHVVEEFGPDLLVLDGGDCQVGIESSIVDCSRGHAVLLRPGVLSAAAIEAALGEPLRARDAAAPRASGTLEAHYAPRAVVRLLDAAGLAQAVSKQSADGLAVYSRSPISAPAALVRTMPQDAVAAAHELFAVLRELDAAGAREIWVESPPPGSDWDGVRDRLTRAAAAQGSGGEG